MFYYQASLPPKCNIPPNIKGIYVTFLIKAMIVKRVSFCPCQELVYVVPLKDNYQYRKGE